MKSTTLFGYLAPLVFVFAALPVGAEEKPTDQEVRRAIEKLERGTLRQMVVAERLLLRIDVQQVPLLGATSKDYRAAMRKAKLLIGLHYSDRPGVSEAAEKAAVELAKDRRLASYLTGRFEPELRKHPALHKMGADIKMERGAYFVKISSQTGWKGGNDGLRELSKLPKLKYLDIGSFNRSSQPDPTVVTDEGLVHLAELNQLESLSLPGFASDDSLKHLSGLTKLKSLRLNYDRFGVMTGSGFAHLRNLKLESLYLSQASVASKHLQHLVAIKTLRKLVAPEFPFTDEGMQHVSRIRSLTSLHLVNTRITDRGMAALGQLSNLQELHIYSAMITDEGLKHLEKLEELKRLFIRHTFVSKDGIQNLKTLPSLYVGELVDPAIGPEYRKALEKFARTGARVSRFRRRLPKGEYKYLTNVRIGPDWRGKPADLVLIKNLVPLAHLWIEHGGVTDGDLSQLAELQVDGVALNGSFSDTAMEHAARLKAKYISIQNTKISAAGAGKLRAAVPNTRINIIPLPK